MEIHSLYYGIICINDGQISRVGVAKDLILWKKENFVFSMQFEVDIPMISVVENRMKKSTLKALRAKCKSLKVIYIKPWS